MLSARIGVYCSNHGNDIEQDLSLIQTNKNHDELKHVDCRVGTVMIRRI